MAMQGATILGFHRARPEPSQKSPRQRIQLLENEMGSAAGSWNAPQNRLAAIPRGSSIQEPHEEEERGSSAAPRDEETGSGVRKGRAVISKA